jgi:hypothetical protein
MPTGFLPIDPHLPTYQREDDMGRKDGMTGLPVIADIRRTWLLNPTKTGSNKLERAASPHPFNTTYANLFNHFIQKYQNVIFYFIQKYQIVLLKVYQLQKADLT